MKPKTYYIQIGPAPDKLPFTRAYLIEVQAYDKVVKVLKQIREHSLADWDQWREDMELIDETLAELGETEQETPEVS